MGATRLGHGKQSLSALYQHADGKAAFDPLQTSISWHAMREQSKQDIPASRKAGLADVEPNNRSGGVSRPVETHRSTWPGSRYRSGAEHRQLAALYALLSVMLIIAAAAYTVGMQHLLYDPASDIFQHLAAINAIAEHPFHPMNPFVESSEPSRLFGPLWVVIGTICRLFGLNVLDGFWIGGIINLILFFTGVWLLGTSLFGGPNGAFALLAAMLGGWIYPVIFTGYHTPITLLSSAGYPAITAVASSLILWGLSIRWLRGSRVGPWIAITGGLAFIVHPMGMAVGLAGCALIAAFEIQGSITRRLAVVGLLAAGISLSAAWPYFNPFDVLRSAPSQNWGAGVDFYNPYWILGSIVPAIIGMPFLFRREMRPFLFLLALCTIGFVMGSTTYFIAGHRLLSWIALLLQIGLAAALLRVFSSRTRMAVGAQALALSLIVVQAVWTFESLEHIQQAMRSKGNLLADARGLLRNANGGFAGYLGASFPITALGHRVLSTPYAEPLVANMPQRQAASKRLFEFENRDERISAARALNVRYLVADVRVIPAAVAGRLSRQARSVLRSGNLVRYQLY